MEVHSNEVGMLFKDVTVGLQVENKVGDVATVTNVSGGWKSVEVEFKDTGYRSTYRWSHLNDGMFRDKYKPCAMGVGFIGDGVHKSKIGKSHTKAYTNWYNMFVRCYSPAYLKDRVTYEGCSVSEDWHNFQNFADWHEENYPNDGGDYHLDKDIKFNGNKVYSPETCLYVSPEDNIVKAHAKHWEFLNPKGEKVIIYNLQKYCRENNLLQCCMYMLHKGEYKQYIGWTKA